MKNIEERLNIVIMDKDELEQLYKDRLDFGFDSIYFRYASAIDELAKYKDKYEHKQYGDFKSWADSQKMHFYMTLEQLVHAHKDNNEKE